MAARARALASLALALFIASGAAASQEAAAGTGEGSVIEKTEAGQAAEDRVALVVTSSVKVASVEINRAYAGKVTYENEALLPGDYLVAVSAPGYATIEFKVELAERTKTSLHFVLVPATSLISVSLEPADAELLIDGALAAGTELPVTAGRHELVARRFGYEERRASVVAAEGERIQVAFALPKAAFALRDLRLSRRSFNPANPGAAGAAAIRFSVTGPGSARLEIRDGAGALVAERDFPDLATWGQSCEWDGRGPDGAPLPDGEYELAIEASPAADSAEGAGPLALRASLRIDSSLLVRASGSLAALPGSLLFPDPRASQGGGASAELAWLFPDTGLGASVLGLGASLSLGRKAALGIGAAAEMKESPEADLGLSFLFSLARGSRLALAAFARGSWSSAPDPLLPGSGAGAELSFPASISLGPLGLGLSPGFFLDLSSSSPSASPLARAGTWLSWPAFRAGISAALALGGEGGLLSPSWPASLCAEARLLLSPSPLAASAYLLASLEPGAAPGFAFGLGLGFAL